MSTPEQAPTGPEKGIETPRVSAEQYESLSNPETAGNIDVESGERKAEKARVEALENAVSVEKGGAEKDKKPSTAAPTRRRGTISKKEKSASFKKHMKQVQSELPAPQRAFSKIIHNPVVEKTSEAVGKTIARPNAILAGSVVAFFAVLAVYLIAKNLGYVLSGFETIAAFIVGWLIGILYDYLRVMITGKK
ncbi:MAG TPA: hypothetical protein QF549_01865 [Candidatus Saccharimonadaceae bacterium]|nr:hypothetical protein [Candidatus Saccharimonadaceae bacterium]|tara:strand:+ start:6867 stop:7442 length:576 start_codon:yes stop_codon:yes gene_type:complete